MRDFGEKGFMMRRGGDKNELLYLIHLKPAPRLLLKEVLPKNSKLILLCLKRICTGPYP